MAAHYKKLAHDKGFVHLYRQIQSSRRRLMESVVYGGDENAEQLRGAIWAFDSLLKLPDEMLNNGAEAERSLRERGLDDGEADE